MQCSTCNEKAVITHPARCKTCFIHGFEERVWNTIERFSLIRPEERICVAASGGKDSLALLEILHTRYDVHALCVDEGIAGYRDQTIDDLKTFCEQRSIPLKLVSFADLGAQRLDAQNPDHPCSVCGVLRRKALMDYSQGYDVIATGHNLDDEAQSILMNLLRNQTHLLERLGPRTPAQEGIAARIKPFYTTPEREVRAYCLLKGITTNFSECPNVVKSFRWKVGEALNDMEVGRPGAKLAIVENFLKKYYRPQQAIASSQTCTRCAGPSSHELCRACRLIVVNN